jgi:hypothetical protein
MNKEKTPKQIVARIVGESVGRTLSETMKSEIILSRELRSD